MVGLLACVLSLFGAASCQWPSTNVDKGQSATSAESTAQVILHPAGSGVPWAVRVELARTEQEIMRGMMFRRSLDADAGMLFLFDRPEIRRFWMRNCYISLDMIFLDETKTVVGIEENTIPGDETGRGPDRPAQYVIEVGGGLARSHGIGLGSRVEFRNVN